MTYMRGTPSERFWAKVDTSGDCWEWQAFIQPNGYGKFAVGVGDYRYAHRFAYEDRIGPIPEGLVIHHRCHNRRCVNPAHLEATTVQHNQVLGPGGFAAANARKTHCPHGHPLDGRRKTGQRYCKECARQRTRAARLAS